MKHKMTSFVLFIPATATAAPTTGSASTAWSKEPAVETGVLSAVGNESG